MIRRIASRIVASFAVVLGAVTLIFLILNWLPGDAAELIAGDAATAETVQRIREQLRTDRPLLTQYGEYLYKLAQGDLGRSYLTSEPVLQRLAAQLPATAALTLSACALAMVLGVLLGVLSARFHGRALDQLIQLFALSVVSMPSFFIGFVAILVFSVQLGWLPVLGDGGFTSSILPVVCLGLIVSGPLLRLTRSSILEGKHEPYVTTLRAKGLGERRIFYVHVLRHALIAAVTLLGVSLGELLSGTVVIETVFARQGIGRIAVEAIGTKDLPMVQGAILLASVVYVTLNLLVDLLYALIDPRTRAGAA